VVAARLYGLLAMRLAGADIVPMRYGAYGRALTRELELLRRESLRDRRSWSAATSDGASIEPGSPAAVEARKRPALAADFAGLARAIAALGEAGDALDAALSRLENQSEDQSGGAAGPRAADLPRLNDALVQVERAFLIPPGLPGRPWFRHSLYAPGLTTGYASWPFPGVAQAIKERNPDMLEAQLRILVERIGAGTQRIAAAQALAH
jgi:N-acetylated-alpha-linked acidic dipeptidase